MADSPSPETEQQNRESDRKADRLFEYGDVIRVVCTDGHRERFTGWCIPRDPGTPLRPSHIYQPARRTAGDPEGERPSDGSRDGFRKVIACAVPSCRNRAKPVRVVIRTHDGGWLHPARLAEVKARYDRGALYAEVLRLAEAHGVDPTAALLAVWAALPPLGKAVVADPPQGLPFDLRERRIMEALTDWPQPTIELRTLAQLDGRLTNQDQDTG